MLSFRNALSSSSQWACELQIRIYCEGAMCHVCEVMDIDGEAMHFMTAP